MELPQAFGDDALALIRAADAGDEEVARACRERLRIDITNFVRHTVVSIAPGLAEDADEVVDDVFKRLAKSPPTRVTRSADRTLLSWIKVTTYRLVVDRAKAMRREEPTDPSDEKYLSWTNQQMGADQEARFAAVERMEAITTLVRDAYPRGLDVLRLLKEECTPDEIADKLSIKRSYVYVIVNKIRRLIAEAGLHHD